MKRLHHIGIVLIVLLVATGCDFYRHIGIGALGNLVYDGFLAADDPAPTLNLPPEIVVNIPPSVVNVTQRNYTTYSVTAPGPVIYYPSPPIVITAAPPVVTVPGCNPHPHFGCDGPPGWEHRP